VTLANGTSPAHRCGALWASPCRKSMDKGPRNGPVESAGRPPHRPSRTGTKNPALAGPRLDQNPRTIAIAALSPARAPRQGS